MSFRSFRVLVFLALLSTAAFAQTAAKPALDVSSIRADVTYLASDKLDGRRTGEKGNELAAKYVVSKFKKAGLKPGVTSNGKASFMQAFPYVSGVTAGKSGLTSVKQGDIEQKFAASDVVPYGNSINGDFSGQVIFQSYGITTPDKTYDNYKDRDVKGKVVMVLDGSPDGDNPHSQVGNFGIHAKSNIAKENGAVAMLLVARTDDFSLDPLSKIRFEPTTGETAIPVMIISRKFAAELNGGSIPTSPLNSNAYIAGRVAVEKVTVQAQNIIGVLPGNDPSLKNEAIVIGAHYDHLGRGGQGSLAPDSNLIHHGADDNASGTAAIIDLAEQFAKAKNNKRTLIFMSFSGEEEGLLGSKAYVDHPQWPLDKTVAMINLDMVGRLNDDKLTIGGIGTSDVWRSMVEKINSSPDLGSATMTETAYLTAAPRPPFTLQLNEDGFGPSDHASFYGKQIPVLFFFTGTHSDYHKPTDTSDKINYDGISRIVSFVSAIVNRVDIDPKRPTYTVAKSAGMSGRTSFNVSLGTIPNYSEGNDGLALDGVRDASPAAKAGLKAGDVIIKLAGKDVRNISDYMYAMSIMKAGQEYEVMIKRGTETLTLKIIPAAANRR